MSARHTKLYRDKQNGKIFGVCAGLADYTGVETIWIRIGLVAAVMIGMGWPFLAYIGAGLILDKKPAALYVDEGEAKYWQGVRQNPQRTAREVKAKMRDIDRRLAEVENFYVSSNPRLSSEIEKLR